MSFIETTDWLRSDTYADLIDEERDRLERIERQNAEDRAYLAAKCDDPHPDGSKCMPDWDGIMFVCFNRILREREGPSSKVGTSQNYRDWIGSA